MHDVASRVKSYTALTFFTSRVSSQWGRFSTHDWIPSLVGDAGQDVGQCRRVERPPVHLACCLVPCTALRRGGGAGRGQRGAAPRPAVGSGGRGQRAPAAADGGRVLPALVPAAGLGPGAGTAAVHRFGAGPDPGGW